MEEMDEKEKKDISSGEDDTILDVRQLNCWKFYTDMKSDTYGNATKSARKAGYSETFSLSIHSRHWFKMKKIRMNLMNKAERVIDRTLSIEPTDRFGNIQADILRVQTDVAKHITKTLGKDEGYSERSEVTGKNGSPIIFMPSELADKYKLLEEKKEEEIKE